MPNGHGAPPPLNVNDPGSLGHYLGWLGSVVSDMYHMVERLQQTNDDRAYNEALAEGARKERRRYTVVAREVGVEIAKVGAGAAIAGIGLLVSGII